MLSPLSRGFDWAIARLKVAIAVPPFISLVLSVFVRKTLMSMSISLPTRLLLLLVGTVPLHLFVAPAWGNTHDSTLSSAKAAVLAADRSNPGIASKSGGGAVEAIAPIVPVALDVPPSTEAADLLPESTENGIEIGQNAPIEEPVEPTDEPTDQEEPIVEAGDFSFRLDPRLPPPTALLGSIRPRVTRTAIKVTGLSLPVSARLATGEFSYFQLGLEGGERIAAFDLGYVSTTDFPRRGFAVNFSNQRSFFPAFRGGDNEVELPNGDDPWLHRLGGGAEIFIPLGNAFESALGVNYQRVSVRDDAFTSALTPLDELGNQLVVNDNEGIDDVVTLNFFARQDTRDDAIFPTEGSIIGFGVDQGFVLEDEDAIFTRLSGNYTRLLPIDFFGFEPGPRTLILNVQSGIILGDVPPYEAFNLGGPASVRGFNGGGVSTGSAFIQGSVEYRFPILSLSLFNQDIPIRGTVFVDYATDFGTADEVIGEPAEVRDKPGSGLGFGLGLHAQTSFGLGRLEFAVTDDDSSELIITVGDRF
jgi:outer membrane protein insertion porin family